MCGLFGFYNYNGSDINKLSNLTNILATNSTVRGTDASGIAYNDNNKLIIHKEAKSAKIVDFKHSNDTVCVTGHTRHATQGNKKKNFNNHPFGGKCGNLQFALSHNGVLTNDITLKIKYNLPKTKIATDSYVAVQLLEKRDILDFDSIRFMAENVNGSFAFSILDSENSLWLIRGDSPLSIVHLPKYKLYIYASTDEILYKSLLETKLFEEIKSANFDDIKINPGDIFKINLSGKITKDKFNYYDYLYDYHWWNYNNKSNLNSYVEDLKSIGVYYGYTSEDIDNLIKEGFSPEEIEENFYCFE